MTNAHKSHRTVEQLRIKDFNNFHSEDCFSIHGKGLNCYSQLESKKTDMTKRPVYFILSTLKFFWKRKKIYKHFYDSGANKILKDYFKVSRSSYLLENC